MVRDWWHRGVIYNAYPRSWQDSNGDGVGDLRGIIERLDHLEWLGVAGLWLNPITPSPNCDWGYDVSDYYAVHPDFGDLDDLDHLVAEARRRGIRIILDLVPAHTSDRHPWFAEARRSPGSRYRDYYVWSYGRPNGSPPTNWVSYFGGSTWTLDEASGQFYLHNFSRHQPQLNWWNAKVREEFDRIFSFWFDRGVAGMRIDALQALVYDPELRDNPPATSKDSPREQSLGQRFMFNANRPEVHDIIRRWRSLANNYDEPRLLFGETWVPTTKELALYYGNGRDELHLAWNLPFLMSPFRAQKLAAVIRRTFDLLPSGAVPTWAMSTHDGEGRAASRWCNGDDETIRCALLILLSLPGTPILYYGDEIGMVEPPPEVLVSHMRDRHDARDANRTPMHWEHGELGGFTTGAAPWLPLGETTRTNVADQREDPTSVLRFCRDLIRLHRKLPSKPMTLLETEPDVLGWRRGDATVAVNFGDKLAATVPGQGTIAVCTDIGRNGERVTDTLRLAPREGAVIWRAQAM